MNIYAVIILSAFMIEFILSRTASVLNLRYINETLPDEFKNYYDKERYKKSQEYTREKTRFSQIAETFDLLVLLGFWFSGGFNWLDMFLRQLELSDIITGILYIGIIGAAKFIIDLPFNIYSTFVIEEKYGFNKTTWKTFLLDIMKGMMLSIILGVPLLAGILAVFQYLGDSAWLVGWAVVTVFTLIIQYIAPRWIMPLFNKFTPLEKGVLYDRIKNYFDSVDYSVSGVYVMDGSRRSQKSNAFFTGFGKNKRIALFDTLIDQHSDDEMLSILAHEVGHYKKKHILKSTLISIVHTGFVFFLLSIFLSHTGLFDAFYMEHMSVYAGLLFFGMLYAPIELFLSLMLNMLSRKHEYEADRFAVKTRQDRESMVKALKKLTVHNLSNLKPHPFYVFLYYSHPPVLERIKMIRNTSL